LASQVALQIDIAALEAVKTSRRISQNSPVVPFPDPPLSSRLRSPNPAKNPASKKGVAPQDDQPDPPNRLRPQIHEGRVLQWKVLRTGHTEVGSQFEGEWLTANCRRFTAAGLGILSSVNECSAAIKDLRHGGGEREAVVDEQQSSVAQSA